MLSLLLFLALFLLSHKSLLIISNFLKIDKTNVSNWYQNFDDKVIWECVGCVLRSLDSILTFRCSKKTLFKKNSKKHIDIKRKATKMSKCYRET